MIWRRSKRKFKSQTGDGRLAVLRWGAGAIVFLLILKLFILQVVNYSFYARAAENRHNLFLELWPKRGQIYFSNFKNPAQPLPLALNKDVYTVAADPKIIKEQIKDIKSAAGILAKKLGLSEEETRIKLTKEKSRYEIIAKKVAAETAEQLKLENLAGLEYEREPARYYPEKTLASQVEGYFGYGQEDLPRGYYGLEGYHNELLAGEMGYLSSERDAKGGWLTLLPRTMKPARDGADLILTIDRTIEYAACRALKEGVEKYQAKGGTVVILNPKNGAVLAMCNEPGFDPNEYNKVEDLRLFNNDAIFTPYEPGSVFKIITMAAALDLNRVTPETKYIDAGALKFGPDIIRNAANKVYGEQTMTGVLKESINTGAVFAARKVGMEAFRKYVKDFGFGVLTGIELDKEAVGDVNSLNEKREIYLATASFGQGITVTPLQLAAAFGAVANKGRLYKPHLVAEIKYADGQREKALPQLARQVISERTARLLSGMMTLVVREGHGKAANVPGYYIAGKTGTAQIPGPGGKYIEDATNQTFIGFGPVDDPEFVMLVKYVEPKVRFAESSAVPTFGEIAKFLVQYLEIPPGK
ncbi:MAG: penicillin-binding protein 2 [Candidatus Magasanikbacteria bacterium]|nr:penicillin-binding protein 2 [Candidatus Magasanikbacteria bacterium]